jgi:chemotaxis protein CheX
MTTVTDNFIEFSKPFMDAAKNVFETMVFTKLETLKPQIKSDTTSRGDISAILGVTGNLSKDGKEIPYRGMLVISWPYETYFKVASAMLMEEYTEYSDEISDVGGEISNMIMGNAKRTLSEMGYTSNMAIPSIIEGQNHSLKYPTGTTVILIPINSAHGQFFMEVCYRED